MAVKMAVHILSDHGNKYGKKIMCPPAYTRIPPKETGSE